MTSSRVPNFHIDIQDKTPFVIPAALGSELSRGQVSSGGRALDL